MAPTSKFRLRSAKIAAQFVQTVVLIDDEAFVHFRKNSSGKVDKIELAEPPLLPGDKPVSPDVSTQSSAGETSRIGHGTGVGSTEKKNEQAVSPPAGETALTVAEKSVVASM